MRRPSGPLFVSILLHIVAGLLLVTLLELPVFWVEDAYQREPPQVAERIGFLRLPDTGEDTPGRSGGDGLPVSERRTPAPPLVAPAGVPAGIPAVPLADDAEPQGGAGPVVGRGGPERGIMPSATDSRIWMTPPREPSLPLTAAERVDSVIATTVRSYNDSVANAPHERRPGDWTFERGGKKYGMDERNIYLGSVRLPTAVLAMLPLNVQSNPVAGERERTLAQMRQTILEQSDRAAVDEDFRAAVKRIRERKERERREREELVASP